MLKLGLGTVQWGTDYGIANHTGMASADNVADILRLAQATGVDTLDTAAAYGTAEEVLGAHGAASLGFKIVTKTLPLRRGEADGKTLAQRIRERFLLSLEKLGVSSVYGLLVHHAADLLATGGELVWDVLSGLRRERLVQKIGCSLYHPAELMQLLQRHELDLVQLPFNVYDQRFLRSGALEAARASNVEIHARSTFLQGLLLMSEADLPASFHAIRAHHGRFHRECRMLGVTPLRAALGFVTQSPWVDKVIVGCESLEQCREILAAATTAPVGKEWEDIFFPLALDDEAYINPGRWPKRA